MRFRLPALLFAAAISVLHAAPPPKTELQPGDHIAIVGNALADRMQHDGTLEALLHRALPEHDLSIRNLGFAADEITSSVRSDGVPKPEEWLAKVKASVVLAFWGFNESFAGYDGIQKFKTDLAAWIDVKLKAGYSGKGAPRLILCSPIAQEKMADPNFPDPAANNTNLQNYTAAMAEVAAEKGVQFVDLFAPSQKLFAAAKQPLTHNGIHLTNAGYEALAPSIANAMLAREPTAADASLEKIRQAVREKNRMWLSRYRTVDQFNIFGGRSTIGYESGKGGPKVDNQAVLHPELAVRDVMTENREKRVWALARGKDLVIDDSNAPPIPRVGTNKPGPLPDGSYSYVDPEEAIKMMTVPKGVKVELVASEKQFPELVSPVQMAWDPKGRLWISVWKNYPERTPWSKDGDKLLVFDIGADGKATKCTTFLDDLNCPTGFQFYKDGVVVMQSPDLWYAADRDGDGKGELVERLLNGLDAADSHHETNSMAIEPGGAIYLSDGVFHRTQVETAWGPVRNVDGALYRWEPRSGRFERYIAYNFANPHGKVFDYWGNDIMTDATGNANFFGPAFSGRLDKGKHPSMKEFWARPSRPSPGTHLLSSRAWPAEFQDNFLNTNVISIQGIFRAKISEEGSGLKGDTLEHLITSTDPNFRPSGVSVAPDGSLYVMDWHKPLIGHLQHHLRDPNREQAHGRIYRLTYEGMPLLKPAPIDGQPILALLELLKTPENNVRERAKIELGKHPSALVTAAAKTWVASLDKGDKEYEHHLLEALWVHQYHHVTDLSLLNRVLASPDPRARTQGVRVLGYWRQLVPDALRLLATAAGDASPRVRLEVVRVASFFDGAQVEEAMQVAMAAISQPTDYYLDYCYAETMRQLQSLTSKVVLPSDPRALTYVVEHMNNDALLKAPPIEPVLVARLERKTIGAPTRESTLAQLITLRKSSRVAELVLAMQRHDGGEDKGTSALPELGQLLGLTSPAEIQKGRSDLISFSNKATQATAQRAVWAAITAADNAPATTWSAAVDESARAALLRSLAAVPDPALRAGFQPQITQILEDPKTSGKVRSAALQALPLMGPQNAIANFQVLASHVQKGTERTVAARAMGQLPLASWDKAAAGPVAESILTWAKSVPAEKRTAQDFVETVQTGVAVAALLPPDDAVRLRKEFRALGVTVHVIKTVREEMRYDVPRLVVEAGKPFEVIVENVDLMPHNFVVVEPGSRQAVAESVQTRKPDQLDRKGRSYVIDNDKRVLEASRMLEPGQKETIKMKAPATEGKYEYVCTFPGHWMIMWGTLIVTKDVDAYLQANPVHSPAAPVATTHGHPGSTVSR